MLRCVLLALSLYPALVLAGDTNAPSNIPPIVPADPTEVTLANQLLTPELAASVLGVKVTMDGHRAGTSTHSGGVSHVAYSAVDTSGQHISLLVRRAGSIQENNLVFTKAKSVRSATPVPGLGDEAFLSKEHALEIRDGSDLLVILAGPYGAPDLAAQEKAARAILQKLHAKPATQGPQ